MLKQNKTRLALWLTLIMTAVSTVLRILLVPLGQSAANGQFHLSYAVVVVMLLTIAVTLFLLIRGRRELPTLPKLRGSWLLPISMVVMLAGLCILLSSVFDMYNWAAYGLTPPPSKALIGSVDRITLFLSLAFGILTGIYLIRLAFLWIGHDEEKCGVMQLWALCPTVWIWMRLARYEISYASAVEVYEGFYDFAMLLFSLLFLFALARHAAAVGALRPQRTLFYALGTVLLSFSGPVARVAFYLLGEGDAYQAGQLAGLADFAVGMLAAAMSLYWILVRPEQAAPKADEPSIPDDEEPATAQEPQDLAPDQSDVPEDIFASDTE